MEILNNENINSNVENPKISDNFNNTKEYYKDLYDQLKYYIIGYKVQSTKKICKIIDEDFYRVLWLNFNKLLLLNLSENNIEENYIKVIFYFIVNLFSPDINIESALEFNVDTIPILYSQCGFSLLLLNHDYIFQILDKDYSQYYTISENKLKYNQVFINIINKEILHNRKVMNYRTNKFKKNCEIKHMLDCCNYLPFPLLQHYFENLLNIKNQQIYLFNFYRNCFCDLGSINQESFIEKTRIINIFDFKESEKKYLIENILKDKDFLNLIKGIMTSTIMNCSFYILNQFYFSEGKLKKNKIIEISKNKKIINLDELKKEEIEKGKMKNNDEIINYNIIKNIKIQAMISYYNRFCEELNNTDNYIIMGLPKEIKCFTFRFLKIIINTKGIILNMDNISKLTLLKAYLIIIIMQEQNNFITRYFNIDSNPNLCVGKNLIKLLFREKTIHEHINLEQAKYILDMNNWTKKSLCLFKNDFEKIKTAGNKDNIIYLTSEYPSSCDHSKLHI